MPITTGGKVLLISGGALLTYLVGREVFAKGRPRTGASECPPYTWDEAEVASTIESLFTQGSLSMEAVAAAAATENFGTHPSGGAAFFPPEGDSLPGVDCIWAMVYDLTQRMWASRPDEVDYAELVANFESGNSEPEMGTFFDRGQGDDILLVSRWTLQNAGIPSGSASPGSANRIAYLRLMECSPYNDALYNVKLDEASYPSRFRNDQPYGISGYPQHYDNLMRMKQGLAPRRAARRSSMSATSEQVPGGKRPADMWLPLLKPGTEFVGPNSVAVWQDGTSAINPPAEILALGLENVPPADYGCAPWRTRFESF